MDDSRKVSTRPLPRRLHTESDLQKDQLDFFRSSNLLPSQQDNIQQDVADEYDLGTLSMAKTARTPTSSLLPEITERKVTSRRRRQKHQPKSQSSTTGFPLAEEIGEKQSIFSKRRGKNVLDTVDNLNENQVNVSEEVQFKNISDEVRQTVASMSSQEIWQAQQEIYSNLKPENIDFLKNRWRGKHNTASSQPSQNIGHEESSVETIKNDKAPNVSESVACTDTNDSGIAERKNYVESGNSQREYSPEGDNQKHVSFDVKEKGKNLSEVLQHGNEGVKATTEDEEFEQEKRKWMKDTSEYIESQASIDEMLEETVKSLGPIGTARFNLDGQILSKEEIDSLPTNIGLHHHGSSPERAGYTLTDVLTLTRSTVLTQRIMSLKILSGMLRQYGDTIADPLIESGGVSLIFSPFLSHSTSHSALTSHISYIEVVEALVKLKFEVERESTSPDLYFASSYYSTSLFIDASSKLFSLLVDSDCIPTLIRIAVANNVSNGSIDVTLRALSVLKAILIHNETASGKIFETNVTINGLLSIASGHNEVDLSPIPEACKILQYSSLVVAWNNQELIHTLDKTVFRDVFLQRMGVHLGWLLHKIPSQASDIRVACAHGAVLVFRAALAFQRGIIPFSAILQPLSVLLTYSGDVSTNAYLALEAYVHCLYTRAADTNDESCEGESKHRKPIDRQLEADFLNNQMAGLIPIAISALEVFSGNNKQHSNMKRAAAGHFAATLFASSGLLQDKKLYARIFNTCTNASKSIVDRLGDTTKIRDIQSLASISHAGVRLLSKVKMEYGYIRREVDALWKGLCFEKTSLAERISGKFWRPLANCCAEWAGALSRTNCDLNSFKRCVELLPYISDNQVIVDLLARGILKVDVLRALDMNLSTEIGKKCAKDLLPATLNELNSRLTNVKLENDSLKNRKCYEELVSLSLEDLVRLWSEKEDTFQSFEVFVKVVYPYDVISCTALCTFLLHIPKSCYEHKEQAFHTVFEVAMACINKGENLIQNIQETVLSAKSTTTDTQLTTSILELADFLVLRGPLTDYQDSKGNQIDTLSSIMLALMVRSESDVSLRISLWRKTIEDCGGGSLFKDAVFLRNIAVKSETEELSDEHMLFFQAFCTALQQGIFLGERCPDVLCEAFCAYLTGKLTSNGIENEIFRDAINANSKICLESLGNMFRSAAIPTIERDFLEQWMKRNGFNT